MDLEAQTRGPFSGPDGGYLFGPDEEMRYPHTRPGWGPGYGRFHDGRGNVTGSAPGPSAAYGPMPPPQSTWADAPAGDAASAYATPTGGQTPPAGGMGGGRGNLRGSNREAGGSAGGDVSAATVVSVRSGLLFLPCRMILRNIRLGGSSCRPRS